MKKEPVNLVIVWCFFTVLGCFSIFSAGAMFSDTEFSLEENRFLAKRPFLTAKSYFSGTYNAGWEDYITDHVPYRSTFIRSAKYIESISGISADVKIVEVAADIGVATNIDDPPKQTLLVLEDRILEVYTYNMAICDSYREACNLIAASMPEDIQIYAMLIPTRIEFEAEQYSKESDSQKTAIDKIYSEYDQKVKAVDAYKELQRRNSEYIYFRTDHHWSALGAYYSMRAFAETAGFEPYGLEQYKRTDVENYLGSLYRQYSDQRIEKNPDTLSYYIRNNKNNKMDSYYYDGSSQLNSFMSDMLNLDLLTPEPSYGIFLGGDYPLVTVEGDANNNRVLAVIKDSYGNAFIPWLTPYFSRIVGIDTRTFRENINETLISNEVTDLLILNTMKITMFADYVETLKVLSNK